MKQKLLLIIFSSLTLLVFSSPLEARSFRVNQIPNGSVNSCANCHVNPNGGGPRNEFGSLIESSHLDGGGNVLWSPALAMADPDADGFSNGHELQDPFGLWSVGENAPGNVSSVSEPGNQTSLPPLEAQAFSLHFSLSGMTPHLGQYFQIRVENAATSAEVATHELTSIANESFDLTFDHVLEAGQSYDIDLWTDHNGNGLYDPPPTDHAWRVTLSEVSTDQAESFTHNTNFTDIGSPLGIDDESQQPTDLKLHANYPNPFNPETILSFSLDTPQEVSLDVYDLRGNHIRSMHAGYTEPGQHTFRFNAVDTKGNPLPAGIYLYQVIAGQNIQTQRMTLLK